METISELYLYNEIFQFLDVKKLSLFYASPQYRPIILYLRSRKSFWKKKVLALHGFDILKEVKGKVDEWAKTYYVINTSPNFTSMISRRKTFKNTREYEILFKFVYEMKLRLLTPSIFSDACGHVKANIITAKHYISIKEDHLFRILFEITTMTELDMPIILLFRYCCQLKKLQYLVMVFQSNWFRNQPILKDKIASEMIMTLRKLKATNTLQSLIDSGKLFSKNFVA